MTVRNLESTAKPDSRRVLILLCTTKTFEMNDGRKSQIVLLDERRLDLTIQPKLFAGELLDLAASHFQLKEKQYFGLAFLDEFSHYHWLNLEKRVLDHDLPRKSGVLLLYFAIRFYVDTIGMLRDIQTVELFYYNARQAIFKGHLECDSETVFELAAHVLQASKGDFTSEKDAKDDIKKMPILPTRTLNEHPSISYCEDRVIYHYKKLLGTSRGLAIVNYMTIVEKLPTYGIHYYEVKDKKEIPWWLGISPQGIAVFDKNDRTTPRKMFTWKTLENLYYRDKKFSIEVHDPKRIVHTLSSFNLFEDAIREPLENFDDLSDAITDPTTQVSVSRRTFGTSSVNVHAWLAATQQLTKCIWSMAVEQHKFYLERKQSKGTMMAARSMSEIAADLGRSSGSLVGSDISRNASSSSLPSLLGSRFELNTESAESHKAERDMCAALKARKEALEEMLRRKLEELKILCFQEGELTGVLPKETPLEAGERVPTFRRRVGTSFAINTQALEQKDGVEKRLATLEMEYDLQCKIKAAAHRLAQDKNTSKYVRKQRRQSYNKASTKLKEMEKKLIEAKKQAGKSVEKRHKEETTAQLTEEAAAQQRWESRVNASHDRAATLPPHPPSHHHHHQQHHHYLQQQQQLGPPPSALSSSHLSISPSSSSPQLASGGGYQVSSVYDTRTQYRTQMYPTLSSNSLSRQTMSPTSSLSPSSSRSLADDLSSSSLASSSNNLYIVPLQQTSRYESSDILRSPHSASDVSTGDEQQKLQLPSKHGSLDRSYKRGENNYGSLDRKQRRQRERQHGYSVGAGEQPQREGGTPFLHLDLTPAYAAGLSGQSVNADYSSPAHLKVELPVYHEKFYRTPDGEGGWREIRTVSPSAAVLSPESARFASHIPHGHDTYSPRLTETAYQPRQPSWDSEGVQRDGLQSPPYHHHHPHLAHSPQPGYTPHSGKHEPVPVPVLHVQSLPLSPLSPTQPSSAHSTLVTISRMTPHMEVTKPYETADFYKYSERLRKQRIIDTYQRQLMGGNVANRSNASSPSSENSDSLSLHSSHSGSSVSHSMRLQAASAAYFAATGIGKTGGEVASRGISGSASSHPLYLRQDSDQSTYTAHSDPTDQSSFREPSPYGRDQALYSSGPGMGMVASSSASDFQTARSGQVQFASRSSYRAQYMQAVATASATHSHYHAPAPMACQPVNSQAPLKDNIQGKGRGQ